MKKVLKFIQIEAAVANDGVRESIVLFALDSYGALWMTRDPDSYGDQAKWSPVAQPLASSADGTSHVTDGV